MGKAPHDHGPEASPGAAQAPGPAEMRAARLKAALKANMARRKGQAAARRAPDAAGQAPVAEADDEIPAAGS